MMTEPVFSTFRPRAFFALALPMIVSRTGLATMGIADGLMVARYQAREFAWLSLAEGTLGRLLDVGVALLIGGLLLVPRCLARGDGDGARRLWRRTLTIAAALGALMFCVGLGGGRLLTLAHEAPALAAGAGAVMVILGMGYPAALLAITAAVYLEGARRPHFVAASVVAANLLNIGLNWVLIGGHAGLPALGARGSAWSTTAVRCALAVVLVLYAWRIRYVGPEEPTDEQLQERQANLKSQWRLGLSGAATTVAMVALTAPLLLFAGWLGVLPLAIFCATWNLAAPAGLVTLGLADAAGIQIASAAGRGGERCATAFAWAALKTALIPVGGLLTCWVVFARPIAALYTRDPAMRSAMPGLVPVMACILLIDCAGFVMASSLRALREVAWPVSIEIGSMLLLVPLAATLTFRAGYGIRGLFFAALAAGTLRAGLLAMRLRMRDIPLLQSESWPLHAD